MLLTYAPEHHFARRSIFFLIQFVYDAPVFQAFLRFLMMDFRFVKIAVFVPASHSDVVRQALAQAGAGRIGNYDSCSFSARGIGRFRPLKGAHPFIGSVVDGEGRIEEVEEERIEVICPSEILDAVLAAVKKVHPYEEPAIDVYPLLNDA